MSYKNACSFSRSQPGSDGQDLDGENHSKCFFYRSSLTNSILLPEGDLHLKVNKMNREELGTKLLARAQ